MKLYIVSRIAFADGDCEHSSIQLSTCRKDEAIKFQNAILKKFYRMKPGAIKKYFALTNETNSEIVVTVFNDELSNQSMIYDSFKGKEVKRPKSYGKTICGFDVYAHDKTGDKVVERFVVDELEFEIPTDMITEALSWKELTAATEAVDAKYLKDDIVDHINTKLFAYPRIMEILEDEKRLAELVEFVATEIEEEERYWDEYWNVVDRSIRFFGGPRKSSSVWKTLQTVEEAIQYLICHLTSSYDSEDTAVAEILASPEKQTAIAEAILRINERYPATNSYYWDEIRLIVFGFISQMKAEEAQK